MICASCWTLEFDVVARVDYTTWLEIDTHAPAIFNNWYQRNKTRRQMEQVLCRITQLSPTLINHISRQIRVSDLSKWRPIQISNLVVTWLPTRARIVHRQTTGSGFPNAAALANQKSQAGRQFPQADQRPVAGSNDDTNGIREKRNQVILPWFLHTDFLFSFCRGENSHDADHFLLFTARLFTWHTENGQDRASLYFFGPVSELNPCDRHGPAGK